MNRLARVSHCYTFLLVTLAMIAFAGNSLLCRIALTETAIDAASFTLIRLVSGAVILLMLVRRPAQKPVDGGSWWSAIALFIYALGFSYAYIQLSAAVGALLLFAAVQITMIVYGFYKGERLSALQIVGVILAVGGLGVLLFPGLTSPPLLYAVLMAVAGIAWGVYSLRGMGAGDATRVTTGNFIRASMLAVGFIVPLYIKDKLLLDSTGVILAILSGGLASALGYVIWYRVLPLLRASTAASVQLSVPVIAAVGGALFLNEIMGLRLILASIVILMGIALVVFFKPAIKI